MTRTKYLILGIIVLLIPNAIFLGYEAYRFVYFSFPQVFQKQALTRTSIYQPKLSDEQQAVLQPLPAKATSEQVKSYYDKITQLAKRTNTISLVACNPKPFVAKVRFDKSLILLNPSIEGHTITINIDGTQITYTIKPKTPLSVKPPFPVAIKAYTYTCDNSLKPVGIIFTIKSG